VHNTFHVVIPTVKEREPFCKATTKQWEEIGYQVSVFFQDVSLHCSPCQHGKTSLASLKEIYDAYYRPIIFCEDDVLIDPRIAQIEIPIEVVALTFYLPGKQFYPHRTLTTIQVEPDIFPIINLKSWFGSQCLWLSSLVIEGLLTEEIHAIDGLDERIKRYLLRHKLPLYSIIPNLVQYLSPLSVTSKRYHPHRSVTFGDKSNA
jgi:hypothetical protein